MLLGQPLPAVAPAARVEVGSGAADGDAEPRTVEGDPAAPELPAAEEVVLPAIDASLRDDGWAPLSTVGWHIGATHPFNARNYGYAKLGELVAGLTSVEVRREETPSGSVHVFVRRSGN